ncbi:LuxR family transcriptional regulator [Nonomuraea sp. NPDC050783]|uniref:response regulator transcription factor n=1 Tax=Nonomuraea sp. NPDC050783 TaxID=3154634 RepID=UPI00346715A7
MTMIAIVPNSPILHRGLMDVLQEQGVDIAAITPVVVVVADGERGGLIEGIVDALQRRKPAPDQPPVRHPDLSGRENEVLQRVADGLTQQQIAQSMGISRHTVDTYLRRVRTKLGLGNKAELTRTAVLGPSA